jgi:hypothetical protein
MKKVYTSVWLGILRTFDQKWEKIGFKYDNLTREEKNVMSETAFNYMVSEIEDLKNEEKNGTVYT